MNRLVILLPLAVACSSQEARGPATGAVDCAAIARDSSIRLAQQLQPYDSLMARRTGVYVLEDGDGAMIARAWLSEYAEHTIDVQYFIFSADNVGFIAVDYLLRAADRGVRVRILVDDVLVEADGKELLALDAHPNIEIRIYNPDMNVGKTLPRRLFNVATDFRGINQRMHNKTFTVDGRVVITGGRNIADEYFDYDHAYNFRDRDVLLLGGVVPEIQASFNDFWTSPVSRPVGTLVAPGRAPLDTAATFAWLHRYACNPANYWPQIRERVREIPTAFQRIEASGALQWVDSVRYVSDMPGKNDGTQGLGGGGATLDALVGLVGQARHSIVIQTPYLVTTDWSRGLLRDLVARGVEVRILTNSLASTDNLEAFNGYQRDRTALLGTGIRIFEFRPDAAERYAIMTRDLQASLGFVPIFGLHAKSMVIDGHVTVIGTFNLDPRSANLNTECITIIYSDKIAAGVLAGMETEFRPENAWEATSEADPDVHAGTLKRLKAWSRGVVPKAIL